MNFIFNAKNRLTVNGDLLIEIRNCNDKTIGEINFIDIELGYEISDNNRVNEWKIEIDKVVIDIDGEKYLVDKRIGQNLWSELGDYMENPSTYYKDLTDFIERNYYDFDKANELIDKLNKKGDAV